MENNNLKTVNLLDLFEPFESIDQLLQAMHTCNNLKHYMEIDITVINECVFYMTQKK
jgi:hypothetical protein